MNINLTVDLLILMIANFAVYAVQKVFWGVMLVMGYVL